MCPPGVVEPRCSRSELDRRERFDSSSLRRMEGPSQVRQDSGEHLGITSCSETGGDPNMHCKMMINHDDERAAAADSAAPVAAPCCP